VTIQKAKEVLLTYRAGTSDENDPEVQEALAATGRDNELRAWFETQQQLQQEIRRHLRATPVPGELRDQILAQRKIVPLWQRTEALLAVASLAILAVGILFFMRPHDVSGTLDSFRSRMAGEVLRVYSMDIITNNPVAVRSYLAQKGAPSDFPLPTTLDKLPVLGGARLSWGAVPVSMICFEGPAKKTLFLFVLKTKELAKQTVPTTPIVEEVKGLPSATWKSGQNLYLLAGKVPSSELQKLIPPANM